MTAASFPDLLRKHSEELDAYIESAPDQQSRAAALRLDMATTAELVEFRRIARETSEPLALGPRERVEAGKFIAERSRPECPECHSTDVYETEVETREIVAGEMVTMHGTAFDCIDCHHMWEAEEEV